MGCGLTSATACVRMWWWYGGAATARLCEVRWWKERVRGPGQRAGENFSGRWGPRRVMTSGPNSGIAMGRPWTRLDVLITRHEKHELEQAVPR
jgi:hypothetical protein